MDYGLIIVMGSMCLITALILWEQRRDNMRAEQFRQEYLESLTKQDGATPPPEPEPLDVEESASSGGVQ